MKKQRVTKKQKRQAARFRALSVRIFAALMVLGGLLGLMFFVRPDTSDVEKRKLTEFPKITLSALWNGEFFSDLSLWYSDTFPMRDALIAADHKMESIYGVKTSTMMVGNQKQSDDIPDKKKKESGGAKKAEEVKEISAPDSREMEAEIQNQIQDSLYVKDGAAYTIYYYDQESADIYTAALSNAAAKLKGDTDIYSILVPNSTGVVLPEEEQAKLAGADEKQAIDYYYSLMDGVKKIDTIDTLRKHRDEYLYFRTDHHWTQLAAYYVYLNFCEEKGLEPNDLSEFDKMTFSPFLGTFYQELQNADMAANPDSVDAYVPMATNDMTYTDTDGSEVKWHVIEDVSSWNESSGYYCYIGGDKPLSVIENPTLDDGSSCLVVKESYGNCFIPFLVDHYQTVYIIDFRYAQNNVMDFVKEHQIQDLIIMNNISIIGSKDVASDCSLVQKSAPHPGPDMSLNIFIGLVINQQTDLPGKKSADQQRRRQLPGKKKFLEKQQRRQIDQIKDQIFHDPEHLLFPISCGQVPHLSPDKLNRHNVESHSRIGKYIKFVRYKDESQQHTGQIKGRSHPQSGFPYHDPCKIGRCGKKEQGVGLYDSSEHHEQHRQRQ